jgi:hypothetical protein
MFHGKYWFLCAAVYVWLSEGCYTCHHGFQHLPRTQYKKKIFLKDEQFDYVSPIRIPH